MEAPYSGRRFRQARSSCLAPRPAFHSSAWGPDVSIEVEDVDALYAAALDRGIEIIYPQTAEDWGVRRFFARDPAGQFINILRHIG